MLDEFIPLDDDVAEGNVVPPAGTRQWTLLVVDDDHEVHSVTRFVLHDLRIFGRSLRLLHAYSGQQAREQLRQHPDVAVVLLDVVMETERAGLDLVGHIRDDLHLMECRIILRTGQPGYAPELSVINEYDINDYRTKDELTHTRLITAVSTALRAYEQLRTIGENRRGLELIVHAAADLLEQHAVADLAEGVLSQLAGLLRLPPDGIVCTQKGSPSGGDGDCYYVAGAVGRLAPYIAQPLTSLPDARIVTAIETSVARGQHIFSTDYTVLYLKAGSNQEAAVFLDSGQALVALDRPLLDAFVANIAACFRNVRLVERLNHIAFYDPLTSLPNRLQFIADLDIVAHARAETLVALLDVDHFADLNDALGQDVGNALLLALAERLRANLEPDCRLARVGADVFGVLGPETRMSVNRLLALFQPPFDVGEYQLPVTVTLGLCRNLDTADSGITLLNWANIALSRAKRSRSEAFAYYQTEMEDNTRWRVQAVGRLRLDFEARKLQVWYQPQIALTTGKVVGVEALLRWPDECGFVEPPGVFIPLAEQSGLIVKIGAWVLEEVCSERTRLAAAGFGLLKMAVNVSLPQFHKTGFVNDVEGILRRHRMPGGLLEVEITESTVVDEPRMVLPGLQALKRLGVTIAIDDFGMGHSSFRHLRSLPIDCLKLDPSLVKEIGEGKGGMFAESILHRIGKLGMLSVAEGVENLEQAALLRRLGCTVGQGYLYAAPMPASQLHAWLGEYAPAGRNSDAHAPLL